MSYVLRNLLTYATAENTGWSASNGTITYVTSPKLSGNYAIKLTSSSSSETLVSHASPSQPTAIKSHIYYSCVHILENSNAVGYLQCYWPIAEPYWYDDDYTYGTPPGPYLDYSKRGEWQRVSFRSVRNNWDYTTSAFRFDFESMPSGQVCYLDNMMLIDLTEAFGAGYEPSKKWCDENIPFFEGTLEINNLLIKTQDELDDYTELYLLDDIVDLSKNAHEFTVTGTITKSDLAGYFNKSSLYFNGSSYMTLELPLSDELTVECWVKQENRSTLYPTPFSYTNSAGGRGLYQHFLSTTSLCGSNANNSYTTIGSATDVYLGNWTHICYTIKGNTIKAYLNGKLLGTKTDGASNYQTLMIGSLKDSASSCYFKGWISDFRVSSCIRYKEDYFTPPRRHFNETWKENKNLSIKEKELEYKFLDYIESDRTQYIDTNYKPNQNTKIILDAAIGNGTIQGNTNPYLFYGCRTGNSNWFSMGQGSAANNYTVHGYQGASYVSITTLSAARMPLRRKYIQDKNYFYIDNIQNKTSTDTVFQSNINMYLFCSNENGTTNYFTPMRLYGCKIYEADILVRDFIPAKRIKDNVVGLLDKVNNVFYTDPTGKTFLYYENEISDELETLLDGKNLTTESAKEKPITFTTGTTTLGDNAKINDKSYYFSGSNYITLSDIGPTQGTNDWTIEWWEYPIATVNYCARFHQKNLTTTSDRGLLIGYQSSNNLYFYLSTNSSSWNVANQISMGTIALNKWTHRAVVRKGSYIYLFENGVKKNIVNVGTGSLSPISPPMIGNYNSTYNFKGYIDDFRIWNTAKWVSNFIPNKKRITSKNYSLIKNSWIKTEESEEITLTNLLPKPSEWALSNVTVSNEEFSFATGTTAMALTTLSTPKEGHLYYSRITQKTTSSSHSASDGRFEMFCGDNEFQANLVFGKLTELRSNNEWIKSSQIQNLQSSTYLTSSNNWQLRNFVVNANGSCYRKEPLLIDLTEAFGAGNEPTKEWCDVNIPYFIGTTNIKDGRKCWTKKILI